MLHMPLSEIITKIATGAKRSEDEVKELIKSKCNSHNGLVSEEGAAHIVAHDLNVEIFKVPTENSGKIDIKDVVVGMRTFEIVGKVTQVMAIRTFQKQGKTSQVGNFNLTDETGTTRIVLWDQKANVIKEDKLKQGQIVKIKNGNVKSSNFSPSGKEIHLTIRSQMILDINEEVNVEVPKTPEGGSMETVSIKLKDITANQRIKAQGTIVRVYPPAFYDSCPQCGKKVTPVTEGHKCQEHNIVEPKPAMVLSFILDDGTNAVRFTAFRNEAESLSGMSGSDAKAKAENPVLIQEEFDNLLLGSEIEVTGNVRENKAFDRIEVSINSTNAGLNPVEIAKSMMKK